ncbi:hypothetical protein HK097_002810 [Rhizophlyctis rosea]|uniref:Aminotransferase class V domain-containing protein n=1 Tax=Rhizophlyctis rosea TaxID=64517 RepID=A0AAD5SIL6_9FUNG|nr:hypothetical protein HK097_002810 [Rhizophlyctis rosea]
MNSMKWQWNPLKTRRDSRAKSEPKPIGKDVNSDDFQAANGTITSLLSRVRLKSPPVPFGGETRAVSKTSPEHLAYTSFLKQHPEYLRTLELDDVRKEEFERLDKQRHIYLDYTGGAVYPKSLVESHTSILLHSTLGNPHSVNPTSTLSTEYADAARAAVLRFFEADPKIYDVMFTQNATGALKLVGESYPFTEGSRLLLPLDSHNSVAGISEFAKRKEATVDIIPLQHDLRLDDSDVLKSLHIPPSSASQPNLFIYPAQSNLSGVQHSLEYIRLAKAQGWDVFLDASAYVPTKKLNLSEVPVDFVCISFYKVCLGTLPVLGV